MKKYIRKAIDFTIFLILFIIIFNISKAYYSSIVEKPIIIANNEGVMTILFAVISFLLGYIGLKIVRNIKVTIEYIMQIFKSKRLIVELSKNDFKNKYASSYLGITWGFVQPLVTIGVYWFVFQVGFRSGDVGNVPFILWFICGIIPWFFFSDALSSTTNVFLEYSYLVKKVVFKIEILPIIKVISSLFVHCFFIIFIFIVMAGYGYEIDVYNLQFIYYSGCMIFLVLAVSTITASVILFFRDLGQIIGIILSVGFWFTPIGWNLTMIPEFWARFFKLNPMYYIVTGYRDAFIDKIFFWERPYLTLYFWAFCIVVLTSGVKIFKKLRPHFSDVI